MTRRGDLHGGRKGAEQAHHGLLQPDESGIIQAIEKADAARASHTNGALSHQPEQPGGEHE